MSTIPSGNIPAACPYSKAAQAPAQPPASDAHLDPRDPAGLADKLQDDRGAILPCPFWRVAINSGKIHLDKNGNATIKDVDKLLRDTAGIGFVTRKLAMFGIKKVACELAGKPTGGISGFINTLMVKDLPVLDLYKSSLMHTGDSGTLRGGFHQENLDRLLSYSTDGERVTLTDLAAANKDQVKADPGDHGHQFGVAEFSIILDVFGRKDKAGERYLTKEDATDIFKHNVFPKDWKKPSVGAFTLGSTIYHMFDHQKKDGDRPNGSAPVEGPADGGLGKAAAGAKSCPFLTGQPFSAEEAAKHHAEVLHDPTK
jgi:hypothetical protein